MKKQILLFVLFVVATFASISKSYGQNALAPSPGVATDYAVSVTGASGATGQKYKFFITKNVDLIAGEATPETAGTDFTVNTGAATYNDAANTINHINLTWTLASTASSSAFYLVVKYTETANGCSTENMKVWQIKPANTFLLAIVPSTDKGIELAAADAHQCAANVVGANISTVNADPTLARVTYTYGLNTLYFKVTATGMVGTWRPDIQLSAVAGSNQEYKTVEWTEDMTGTAGWKSFTGAAGAKPSTPTGYPSANTDLATISNATTGSTILIRVVVDNKNFETLTTDQAFQIGIDGYLPTAFTMSDVKTASDLTQEDAYGKKATYTITARPTVTGTTVDFLTKNP